MRKRNNILSVSVVICALLMATVAWGQTGQFTPFTSTPVYLNPAFNGIFNSKYRLSIQSKNQGKSYLKENEYQDYFFTGEMRMHGFGRDHWSVGLELNNSIAGSSRFQNSHILLNTAYLKKLTGSDFRQDAHYLSFGVQLGAGQRRISNEGLIFGDQIDPLTGKTKTESNEQLLNQRQYLDLNAGLVWYFVNQDLYSVTAGISIRHLNRPSISLVQGGKDQLNMAWTAVLNGSFLVSDYISLQPGLIWRNDAVFDNMYLGSQFSAGNFSELDMTLSFGAWLRSNIYSGSFDPASIIITASASKAQMQFGLGINFSINEIQMLDNGLGALEFSAIFQLGSMKKKHHLLCPTL